MTDPRDDKFWNETAEEMRRALHLRPLTDEEAALIDGVRVPDHQNEMFVYQEPK